MSIVRVPAFLSAPPDCVRAQPWMVIEAGVEQPVAEEFDSFDPAAQIHLSRRVDVDADRIRGACGLSRDDGIGVVAMWSSTATRLRGASVPIGLTANGDRVRADIELDLAGHSLGGTLVLRTAVVLLARYHDPVPLLANLEGSVLCEVDEAVRIDLEGAATRFPTELCEFGLGNSFPPGAAWLLDWEPGDLSLPVLGSVRLYMNAAHAAMPGVAAGAKDPASAAIVETLRFDIARQLLTGALRNAELVHGAASFEDGSVGATLRRLCTQVVFPHDSVEAVAHRAAREPARFEADLQARLQLFARPTE
jgi:hypothetical protein